MCFPALFPNNQESVIQSVVQTLTNTNSSIAILMKYFNDPYR